MSCTNSYKSIYFHFTTITHNHQQTTAVSEALDFVKDTVSELSFDEGSIIRPFKILYKGMKNVKEPTQPPSISSLSSLDDHQETSSSISLLPSIRSSNPSHYSKSIHQSIIHVTSGIYTRSIYIYVYIPEDGVSRNR